MSASTPPPKLTIHSSHWDILSCLALSPSGTLLAGIGERIDGSPAQITLWHPTRGDVEASWPAGSAGVSLLWVDDSLLLSAHTDGSLRLWDTKNQKALQSAQPTSQAFSTLALHAKTVYAAGDDGVIFSFHLPSLQPKALSFAWPSDQPIRHLFADPKGRWLAAGGADGEIRLMDCQTGAVTRQMSGHREAICGMMMHPAEERLLSADREGLLFLWYLQGDVEAEEKTETDTPALPITSIALGPSHNQQDGTPISPRLFTAHSDGSVKSWPLDSRRKPKTLKLASSSIASLAVLAQPEGGLLFAASLDRKVQAWNLSTLSEVGDLRLEILSRLQSLTEQATQGKEGLREKAIAHLSEMIKDGDVYSFLLRRLKDEKLPDIRARIAESLAFCVSPQPIAELRRAFEDPHQTVRLAALKALRQLYGETALDPLERALGSNSYELRIVVLQKLVELTKAGIQDAARLIGQSLHDHDERVQIAALNALEAIQREERSPAPLLRVLQSAPVHLKIEAVRRIFSYGFGQHAELRDAMTELLSSSGTSSDDTLLRNLTFEILIATQPDLAEPLRRANPTLDRAIKDLEKTLSKGQTEASGKAPKDKAKAKADEASPAPLPEEETPKRRGKKAAEPPKALPLEALKTLFDGLNCQRTAIAIKAACYLASLHDLSTFGTLLQLSQDPSPIYRADVARALKDLSDPRSIDCLRQMLQDPTKEVRDAAFDSLQSLLSEPLTIATYALQSKHGDIRDRALQKLIPSEKKTPPDGALSLIENALSDADLSVRQEAFKILWNLAPKEPQKALLPALRSLQKDLRLRAIDEALVLGPSSWLKDALRSALSDPEASVREKAWEGLLSLSPKGDASPHQAALGSSFVDIRRKALDALSKLDSSLSRPLLKAALSDTDVSIRKEALQLLLPQHPQSPELFDLAMQLPSWDIRLLLGLHLASYAEPRTLQIAHAYLREEAERLQQTLPPRAPSTPPPAVLDLALLPKEEAQQREGYRDQIFTILSRLGLPEGADLLWPFLSSPNLALSRLALKHIVLCVGPQHRAGLEALFFLPSQDQGIRDIALRGLARLGDPQIEPHVRQLLAKGEGIHSLIALQPEPIDSLLTLMDHSKSETSESALALLLSFALLEARRGETPSILYRMLSARLHPVRFAAASALQIRHDRQKFEAFIFDFLAPKPSLQASPKEKDALQKVASALPLVLSLLFSPLSHLRFVGFRLLEIRPKTDLFLGVLRTASLLFPPDVPSLPPFSTEDKCPPLPQLHSIVFGTYIGLLREDIFSDTAPKAAEQFPELLQAGVLPLSSLLSPLRQALSHKNQPLRKAAFQAFLTLVADGSPYRHAFRSPYEDLGLFALETLLQKQDPSAKELVASALHSQHASVRRKATDLLPSFYSPNDLEPFLLIMRSPHSDIRLLVLERLLEKDDPRVKIALQAALDSDLLDLRLKAAEALAKRKDSLGFEPLVAFLQSEDQNVQSRAISALSSLGDPRTTQAFLQRLENDPQGTARIWELLPTLGSLRDRFAIDWLFLKLQKADYPYLDAAYSALIAIPGHGDTCDTDLLLQILSRLLASKAFHLRERIIATLQPLKRPEAQTLLATLFSDRNERVRQSAVRAAISRFPKLSPDLHLFVPLLEHRDGVIRFEAALLLADNHRKEAFPVLLATFQTSLDASVQIKAVSALGTLGDIRAFDVLWPLCQPDAEFHPAQEKAFAALGRVVPDSRREEVKSILWDRVRNESYSHSVRSSALIGLRYSASDKEALSFLTQALRVSQGWQNWSLRETIAKLLGDLKMTEASDSLQSLLADDYSNVRDAAFASLLSIYGEAHPQPYLFLFECSNFSSFADERRKQTAETLLQMASPLQILERVPAFGLNFLSEASIDPFFLLQTEAADSTPDEPASVPHPQASVVFDALASKVFFFGLRSKESVESGLLDALSSPHLHARQSAAYLLALRQAHHAAPSIASCLDALLPQLPKASSSQRPKLQSLLATGLWSLTSLRFNSLPLALATLALPQAGSLAKLQALRHLHSSSPTNDATLQALQTAASDKSESVRRLALSLLASTQDSLPSAPSSLQARSLASADPASLQGIPLAALLQTRKPHLLLSALSFRKGQDSERLAILQSLALLPSPDSLPVLESLKKDSSESDLIRSAARRSERMIRRDLSLAR